MSVTPGGLRTAALRMAGSIMHVTGGSGAGLGGGIRCPQLPWFHFEVEHERQVV
jgi:hypothetical protein